MNRLLGGSSSTVSGRGPLYVFLLETEIFRGGMISRNANCDVGNGPDSGPRRIRGMGGPFARSRHCKRVLEILLNKTATAHFC